MEIIDTIIRIGLLAMAVWHLFRKEWKPAGSLAAVIVLSFLPTLLRRWLDIHLDPIGRFFYIAILIMTVYLGNTRKLYDRFAWWDRLIHLLSGSLFVNFGIAFSRKVETLPAFAAVLFAFCFSLAGHCLWELLEYAADCWKHSDNQRWQKRNPDRNHQPEGAIQPPGLVDTMNDLLMGLIGAVIAAVVWRLIL